MCPGPRNLSIVSSRGEGIWIRLLLAQGVTGLGFIHCHLKFRRVNGEHLSYVNTMRILIMKFTMENHDSEICCWRSRISPYLLLHAITIKLQFISFSWDSIWFHFHLISSLIRRPPRANARSSVLLGLQVSTDHRWKPSTYYWMYCIN